MEWEAEEDEAARRGHAGAELIRHWTNERLAPDILHQQGALVQRLLERVRTGVCAVDGHVGLC